MRLNLCVDCPEAWNCDYYESNVNRRVVYCPRRDNNGGEKQT